MTLRDIYEKVNLVTPLEQRRFFNCLEDTLVELMSLYDVEYDLDDYKDLSAELEYPLFSSAIVDNILYMQGQGNERKSEFARKAQAAHLKYWNENAKGRRIRRTGW